MPTAALLNQQQQIALDDGDWWAGTQKCAATIVLAVALTLSAFSTTQAAQVYSYQQDELAGVRADEDFWQSSVSQAASAVPAAFSDDEIVVLHLDEDFWQNPVAPSLATFGSLYLPDSEEISANTLHGQFDEDFWINPVPPVLSTFAWPQQSNFDVQEPTGSLFGQPDEDFWQNAVAPVQATFVWPQQSSFDVQEPAGSLRGQPDEDFWQNFVPPVQSTFVWFQQSSFDAQEFVGSSNAFDEDFWQNLIAPTQATFVWPQQHAFDIQEPAGSLHGQPDEDFWQNTVVPTLSVYARLDQSLFEQHDIVPLVGQPDEDFWQNAVSPTQSVFAYPQQFAFDVQEPAGSLHGQPDEDFWQNAVSPLTNTFVRLDQSAFEQHDVVPVIGLPDEDFWKNHVPPVQAGLYQNLPYLPDLEEIPAGSLIPPVPPTPPVFQPIVLGPVLNSFGVSVSNPAVISTASNGLNIFQVGGNKFLLAPGGYRLFEMRSCHIVAGGTIVVPPSGINAGANFVLTLKGFSQRTQPAVDILDDVMATLPQMQSLPAGTSLWQLVCKLTAAQSGNTGPAFDKRAGRLRVDYMIMVGGVYYSGTQLSGNNPFLEALLQFSLGVQFTGLVSGPDQFQASLYQFETQQ